MQIYRKKRINQNIEPVNCAKNVLRECIYLLLLYILNNLLVAGTRFGLFVGITDAYAEQRLIALTEAE